MRLRDVAFDALSVLVALVVAFAVPPAPWVERFYSDGAYPAIDRVVRSVTGPFPFCVADVLVFVALAWLVFYWVSRVRGALPGFGEHARTVGLAALRTVAAACVVYIWFMVSWAYNYSRIPVAAKIIVREQHGGDGAVNALADRAADELSLYAPAAHRERSDDAWFAARLQPAFSATVRRLGGVPSLPPPRVKPTIFQPFMQLSATSGFTDPWTHEINLNAEAYRVERPALYAHEWGHLSGFADEAEANFISTIACTTSHDPLLAYSGWILVWFNLPPDVHVTHPLSALARADIEAIRRRYEREANLQVARAQAAAYNGYLKSNHVRAGYASYGLFIRWLIGAEFDRNGLPVVREYSR